MSALHVTNMAGGVLCGRQEGIRGFIPAEAARSLSSQGKIRRRIKTRASHVCSHREGGNCYVIRDGRKQDAGCHRVKREVSGLCQDCERRL